MKAENIVTGASKKTDLELHVGWKERLGNEKRFRQMHKKGDS